MLLAALLALRLPSLAQPAGGDQGLYAYAGGQVRAGSVPYRDVWEQKPPGILALYAALGTIWPYESMVPAADLAVAALVAGLLVVLGRRRLTPAIGVASAALFLVFGDPYLQRLAGIYVRGQCEPFIAAAVTAGLFALSARDRRPIHLLTAGVALAAAFWLKYNAAAYALPVVAAAWAWRPATADRIDGARDVLAEVAWIGTGFAAVSAAVVGYFAINGALFDFRLATFDYNLRYSNETYDSPTGVLVYLVVFPIVRARIDVIWFLGGLGVMLLALDRGRQGTRAVILAWVVAAVVSIGINGSRSLPNYFVQANPALALAAAAGLATLRTHGPGVRAIVGLLLLAALWRVGSDTPVWGLRLASLPGLVENVRYDLDHVRGVINRDAYLSRFRGQKHDALENERIAEDLTRTTAPGDPVLVFGFSGGSIGWKSDRRSPSRFFWSRPVIIEFAAGRPGYGSAGLLHDLERHPPAAVVLQKDEWRSRDFFLGHDRLRQWLEAGYVRERETTMFSVWRAKTPDARQLSPGPAIR